MKLLYVEDDEDLRELFVMKIESRYDFEIIESDNPSDAIELLSSDDQIKFILSDYNLLDGTATEIYNSIKKNDSPIPFMLFTSEDPNILPGFESFFIENDSNALIDKPPVENSLFNSIDKIISSFEKLSIPATKETTGDMEYSKIKTTFFQKLNHSPTDVYIKLSEVKFIKIFHKDEMYGSENVEKYIERGITHLYIEKANYENFADYSMNSLLTTLLTESEKGNHKSVNTLVQIHESVHEKMMNVGISPSITADAKKAIDVSIKILESIPSLSDLLNNLVLNGDYIYEHSLMVSYMACAIAANIDWESKDTKVKLSMAAFMHDITLKDHKLAKIPSLNNKEGLEGLSESEIEIIKKHPLESMNLVDQLKELPPDINLIVLQHHEKPDGKGFPRGMNALNVSPLAAVFITAHIFTDYLYATNSFEKTKHDEFLEGLRSKFLKGNYRKPLEGLYKCFKFK